MTLIAFSTNPGMGLVTTEDLMYKLHNTETQYEETVYGYHTALTDTWLPEGHSLENR